MIRKIWTENDITTLTTMFPHNYTEDICKILNRSYSSVAGKALILGLKKSRIFKEIEQSKTADRLRLIGRFWACSSRGLDALLFNYPQKLIRSTQLN